MTDYSKTTDFTGKNTLPDTSPDKVISGVDFDLEFNAVAAASASKLDKTGGTISGTLGVTGDTTVSNIEATGVITADLGLVGAPSIDFGSTTGFYTPANQTVGVTNAGALTATFNSDGTISTYPSGSPEEVAIKSYVDARAPIASLTMITNGTTSPTIVTSFNITPVAYGVIEGTIGVITNKVLVGASSAVMVGGVITVTLSSALALLTDLVISASVGNWNANGLLCHVTVVAKTTSTFEIRVYNASGTLLTSNINDHRVSWSVIDGAA